MKNPGISKLYSPMSWFCIVWAFAVFTPLIYFPAPSVLAGHPWKTELTISLILILVIAGLIFLKWENPLDFPLDREITLWVIAPIAAFVIWSGLSAVWAGSTESVAHHTLVWAVYLIFFLFATQIAADKKLLALSLTTLGLIIGAIAVQCIVEHTFSLEISEIFGFRFARYAEIHAAILPLFLSFILRFRKKYLWRAVFLSSVVWLAILFSGSRGAFLSAIVGVVIFTLLRVFSKPNLTEKKRLASAIVGFFILTVAVQFLPTALDKDNINTLNRLAQTSSMDNSDGFSTNIRFFYGQVGLQMFSDNRLIGVGADNFGLEFNNYRKIFSADEKNKSVAGQQEGRMPERAHNEYLQIFAELGAVGGFTFLLFIFGIFKLSVNRIKTSEPSRNNSLTHAALAGIVAFLMSSMFSSFSFRLMQNGLVFFFLLALLLKNHFSPTFKLTFNSPKQSVFPANLRKICIVTAVCLCFGLGALSTLKAASQYLVYSAETEPNFSRAANYYQQAMIFDPANGSANYLLANRLIEERDYENAAVQFRKAIEKGLNTSLCYSQLSTAQILSGDKRAAEKTLEESIGIFPYSVFTRVKYSEVLENDGKHSDAEKQFQAAQLINLKQAESWRIFIHEGAAAANKRALSSKETLDITYLLPSQAVPLILAEREILHPEEVIRFDFTK